MIVQNFSINYCNFLMFSMLKKSVVVFVIRLSRSVLIFFINGVLKSVNVYVVMNLNVLEDRGSMKLIVNVYRNFQDVKYGYVMYYCFVYFGLL